MEVVVPTDIEVREAIEKRELAARLSPVSIGMLSELINIGDLALDHVSRYLYGLSGDKILLHLDGADKRDILEEIQAHGNSVTLNGAFSEIERLNEIIMREDSANADSIKDHAHKVAINTERMTTSLLLFAFEIHKTFLPNRPLPSNTLLREDERRKQRIGYFRTKIGILQSFAEIIAQNLDFSDSDYPWLHNRLKFFFGNTIKEMAPMLKAINDEIRNKASPHPDEVLDPPKVNKICRELLGHYQTNRDYFPILCMAKSCRLTSAGTEIEVEDEYSKIRTLRFSGNILQRVSIDSIYFLYDDQITRPVHYCPAFLEYPDLKMVYNEVFNNVVPPE